MKTRITLFALFIGLFSYGQDSTGIDFINAMRAPDANFYDIQAEVSLYPSKVISCVANPLIALLNALLVTS